MKRLHMTYEKHATWSVTFRDSSDDRVRFRELRFADSAKIEDMVARTATKMILENKQAFELGLSLGRGAINLTVTNEQYKALLR